MAIWLASTGTVVAAAAGVGGGVAGHDLGGCAAGVQQPGRPCSPR